MTRGACVAALLALTGCSLGREPIRSTSASVAQADDEDAGVEYGCYTACEDDAGTLQVTWIEDGVYPDDCECP